MGHLGRSWLFALLLSVMPKIAPGAPARPSEHVVQSGQTLAKIAKRYQLSIDELCEANDIKRSARLKPGQRLALPDEDGNVETAPPNKERHDRERSPATVGRGRGTAQKLTNLRGASYSRYLKPPTKRGYVHILGHHGEFKGQLVGKSGKLQPKAVVALSKVLAWPRTDFLMDRRLLLLLAKVSDAFGGRMLRVVSGYRTTSFASESKHPLGRACDFSMPGVPNAALRDFARTFNDVGVGYYPNSTFIHLDARDYDAYWVDYSGPGEAPRKRQNAVARSEHAHSDESVEGRHLRPSQDRDVATAPAESTHSVVDETLADGNADETPAQRKTVTATPQTKALAVESSPAAEPQAKQAPNAPSAENAEAL